MRDEMDELFRKTLDALPDTPPVGSTFSADALWSKLDGDLRPRRRITGWWVAASVTLLALSGVGWWWNFSGEKGPQVAVQQNVPKKVIPVNVEKAPENQFPNPPTSPLALVRNRETTVAHPEWKRAKPGDVATLNATDPPQMVAVPAPQSPAKTTKTNTTAFSEPAVNEQRPPTQVFKNSVNSIVVSGNRPRFRVVPANEILVEEEARPKLHRNEGFVRVFIGVPTPPEFNVSEPHRPLILSTKTTQ